MLPQPPGTHHWLGQGRTELCDGPTVDGTCYTLTRAGTSCMAECGSLFATDHGGTISGSHQRHVTDALAEHYGLGS